MPGVLCYSVCKFCEWSSALQVLPAELPVGNHIVKPELHGVNGHGHFVQIFFDGFKILQLVRRDGSVNGNLNQALFLLREMVHEIQHLQGDRGQILGFNLCHV